MCFWYDAEMNNGGFSGYSDVYPDTDLKELEDALREIANDDFADNLCKAINEGKPMAGRKPIWHFTDLNRLLLPYLRNMLKLTKT